MIFRKTVDSILSSVNKNIRDLRAFAASQRSTSEREYAESVRFLESSLSRTREAGRAESVAEKLEQLIA